MTRMESRRSGRLVLPVSGMDCASCVQTIEQALRALPGVAEASGNFVAKNATVACDANTTLRP